MSAYPPLPPFLPTAPPHPSSCSESSSDIEPTFPPLGFNGYAGPQPMASVHHQQSHGLPPPIPPAYMSPGMGHAPPFADGQQHGLQVSPPMSSMMPLPPWVEAAPMIPMSSHGTNGDPFKPYMPIDSRIGPPPSSLGFFPGPLAPQQQPPRPSATHMGMDPFPYPLHHLPPPVANDTLTNASHSNFPRPHPYIVSSAPDRADTTDAYHSVPQLSGRRCVGTRHPRYSPASGSRCNRYLDHACCPCRQQDLA